MADRKELTSMILEIEELAFWRRGIKSNRYLHALV